MAIIIFLNKIAYLSYLRIPDTKTMLDSAHPMTIIPPHTIDGALKNREYLEQA